MADEYIRTTTITLLYVLAMIGWGGLFARLLRPGATFWQELAARFVLGCSCLYALFIALSCAGRLHRVETSVVVVLGMLLACAEIPVIAKLASSALADVRTWSRTDHILAVVAGVYAALQIVSGFTPLMFYDLQVYHFLAPAQFLTSGSLSHILWNANTNTPLAMQFILGMSLAVEASGRVVKLMFTLLGCLAAVGIYEFIRPAGLRIGLLAAVCALSLPEFLLMQTFGAVDLAIAGLLIFGAIWTRRALQDGSWRLGVLAGLTFGLALGSRYQAMVHVCWIVTVLLAAAKLTKQAPSVAVMMRRLVLIGALVVVMVSPWLVRNYLHLGNPVFPLMQSVWNSTSEWSPVQAEAWRFAGFGPRFDALPTIQKILAPVGALLMFPSNGLFGTATLLAGLIGVVVSKAEVRLASVLGLGGLVIWGMLHPGHGAELLRYNALSLLFLLAATGSILGSDWIPSRAGATIGLALSGGSVLIGIVHVQSILPAAQSLINVQARETIHRTNVPSWEAFDYINQRFDRQHDKVLLIGETRAFWLSVPYIAPSPFNGPQLDRIFGGETDPDSWSREFSRLGLTHMLVSNAEIERWHTQYGYLNLSPAQADKLNHWMATLPKVFDDNRGNVVLSLGAVSSAR